MKKVKNNQQYLSIPVFELYDTCRIESEFFMQKDEKQVIKHTRITYSLSESGELIKDEHFLDQLVDTGFNRSLSEVDDYEKYLNIHNGTESGWFYLECRNEFLGKRNIEVYESLLQIAADYLKRFENIKDTEFAQKVLQYFIKVQLEFESWFWQNDISIPKSVKAKDATNLTSPQSKDKNTEPEKYKKDINKEAKLFIKIVKETKAPVPKLNVLKNKTGISISTWHRRLYDKEFLKKVNELLVEEREKLPTDDSLNDILDEIQQKISLRLYKKFIPKKNDIFDKGKKNTSKAIEEYPSLKEEDLEETDQEGEGYLTSKSFSTYKIILN